MQLLPTLFSESGGLVYHALALRKSRGEWKPFRNVIEKWLLEWRPNVSLGKVGNASSTLIIFGPSGGWTLPEKFLQSFARVVCIEPDPVARWILKRRFGDGVNLEFDASAERLPWTSKNGRGFVEILQRYPTAAILFSNILGQLPHIAPSTYASAELREIFLTHLQNRTWASYHDVLSADSRLSRQTPLYLEGLVELETLAVDFLEGSASMTVRDHETQWLHARQFVGWQLTSGVAHVVGFISKVSGEARQQDTTNR